MRELGPQKTLSANITGQCPKLRFKFVHLPGAEGGKCVHPELK